MGIGAGRIVVARRRTANPVVRVPARIGTAVDALVVFALSEPRPANCSLRTSARWCDGPGRLTLEHRAGREAFLSARCD